MNRPLIVPLNEASENIFCKEGINNQLIKRLSHVQPNRLLSTQDSQKHNDEKQYKIAYLNVEKSMMK